jgi:glycosyltransferase involved in cell wall biosynthesis
MNKNLRVAMIAPPWLPIPPSGYGGVENVLNALVPALRRLGVEVVLFTVGDSRLEADAKYAVYQTGQYADIHKPSYDSLAIYAAHLLKALEVIRQDNNFDVIHDHNTCVGPLVFAFAGECLPPAIHTIHNPPFTADDNLSDMPDNRPMWRQLAVTAQRLHLVSISQAMHNAAPKEIEKLLLPPVHNAVVLEDFPFVEKKSDYFITLARFHPQKGQHVAIKACLELGARLRMAGNIGDITTKRKLMLELANPLSPYRSLTDFRYYSDMIYPQTVGDAAIDYIGEVSGQHKLDFISHARALLFPIQWEEPFGMAPLEALACGTPVVAMARGAMPEIIQHGVNGFLAQNEKEFIDYTSRVGEIDPAACRKSVEEGFSAEIMAKRYLEHYKTVIK